MYRPNNSGRGGGGRGRYRPPAKPKAAVPEKEEGIELEGVVTEKLPNAQFKVRLNDTESEILAYLSGKMRKHYIRILAGDKVKVCVSPYDLARARIIYRYK